MPQFSILPEHIVRWLHHWQTKETHTQSFKHTKVTRRTEDT
jgi:hypothetical protein